MANSESPRPKRDMTAVYAAGLILAGIVASVLLVAASWRRLRSEQLALVSQQPEPSEQLIWTAVPTAAPGGLPAPQVRVDAGAPTPADPPPSPTSPPSAIATPTATPEPSATPTETVPPSPHVQVGENGANVRVGPGLNYDRRGYMEAGAEAPVTGRYGTWWEIEYLGAAGWVYGEIVSAFSTDDVPVVQPPPAPTATPAPPTATPEPPPPPPDFRGLVVNSYYVEGAPGPYGVNQMIWFNMDITNAGGGTVAYRYLGTWVEQTEQYQTSWANSKFKPGQHFTWRDHIDIPAAGSYSLWMRICFTDGVCQNMAGPVGVTVH